MTPPPQSSVVDDNFDVPSRKGQIITQPSREPGRDPSYGPIIRTGARSESVALPGVQEEVPRGSTAANDRRLGKDADDRWPPHWPVVAASAIAGGAVAAGVVLTTFAALDEGVNVYVALAVALGGIVLLATLITALRDDS